jgi:hypothetical protein
MGNPFKVPIIKLFISKGREIQTGRAVSFNTKNEVSQK